MKKIIVGIIFAAVMLSGNLFAEDNIEYYTCGMHPSVRIAPKDYTPETMCPICNMRLTPVYKEIVEEEDVYYGCGMEGEEHVFQMKQAMGMKKCPICGMDLIKLSKKEADILRGVTGRIKIKKEQATLAGVAVELIEKRQLHKEIRTIGKVAYDPQLAVAQEEFIAAVKTSDKMKESAILEIKERALKLVDSSKRKLRLLGLSEEQIADLEEKKEIQTSLILPEKKMWIYGEVYEYEMNWVKTGQKAEVMASSVPGEVFEGIISSINPVLDPKTRSVRFRVEIDNPGLKLKPEMYVDIIISSMYISPEGEHDVLAVARDAILDTGTRKVVWVEEDSGEYKGKEIVVGPEATATVDGKKRSFYPVIKGLARGERVVTKANFLIDSQSQISGVAAAAYGGALGAEEKSAAQTHQH